MVAAVLGRLKPNKSPGVDGHHPRVLVELKNEMATPLRMIFTCSLRHEGQLPPSWKEANVTPIYKKGKRHIPGNYRPVSLTSVAGKCMERLIRDAIMTHTTENDLLSPTWQRCNQLKDKPQRVTRYGRHVQKILR